ncbi:MAG TPA: hypothetical protein VGF69_23880 [Thermoanaerobaculia bacterium]|jgi:hypothetical protein
MLPLLADVQDAHTRFYEEHFPRLACLLGMSGIAAGEAADLIEEALYAFLHRPRVNTEQWLIAAVSAAATETEESK